MQIFVLGKTKTGKTTLSKQLQTLLKPQIYEAGSWARQEFIAAFPEKQGNEFSNEFKNDLTQYALDKLKANPYHSVQKYEAWKKTHRGLVTVIIGVRNPDDFLSMLRLDSDNRIIFIESEKVFHGQLELFEKGLNIIRDYLDWKNQLGYIFKEVRLKDSELDSSETEKKLALLLKG